MGICPVCKLRFQIPFGDAQTSVREETEPSSDLNYELVQAGPFVSRHFPVSESEEDTSLSSLDHEEFGNSVDSNTSTASSGEPEPDSVSDTWYILGSDGREYGPMSKDVIRSRIKASRLSGKTIVWRVGGARKQVRLFPELAVKKNRLGFGSYVGLALVMGFLLLLFIVLTEAGVGVAVIVGAVIGIIIGIGKLFAPRNISS